MSRRVWDEHDFDDPDTNPITRLRHLGGDYGPYDPAVSGLEGLQFGSDDDGWENVEDHGALDDDDDDDDDDLDIDKFPIYPRNPKDEPNPNGVLFLCRTSYFIPQWDEHVIGPSWRTLRAEWDFDNPAKPLPPTDDLMKDAFRYCAECQLTWLVGFSGPEANVHPEHDAYVPDDENLDIYAVDAYSMSSSSLIVHVSGALPKGQGSSDRAAIGVFFGEGSRYNVSELLPPDEGSGAYNKEKAELKAVLRALDIVENRVLPDWQRPIKEAFAELRAKYDGGEGGEMPDPDDDDDDSTGSFRVILVSDSADLVDTVCKHKAKWKRGEDGTLRNKQRKPVKNGAEYTELAAVTARMESPDRACFIFWYPVAKQFNAGAAALTSSALAAGENGAGSSGAAP